MKTSKYPETSSRGQIIYHLSFISIACTCLRKCREQIDINSVSHEKDTYVIMNTLGYAQLPPG